MDNTAEEALAAARIAARTRLDEHHRRHLAVPHAAFPVCIPTGVEGTGIDVQVRGTRYDDIDPDQWWKRRGDFRFVSWELQKLIAYRLGVGPVTRQLPTPNLQLPMECLDPDAT